MPNVGRPQNGTIEFNAYDVHLERSGDSLYQKRSVDTTSRKQKFVSTQNVEPREGEAGDILLFGE